MTNRASTIFRDELRYIAEEDHKISQADRATLLKLADDPCIEGVWTKIVKFCGTGANLLLRPFIRDIISNRRLAARAAIWPDDLAYAKKAEHLGKFLTGEAGLFPPLPGREYSEFADSLQRVGGQLRQLGKKSIVRISRKKVDGSPNYHLFMQLMNDTMRDLFHRCFDAEVADLTNNIFPHAKATIDSVRSLRRPSTKAARLGKNLAT